MNEQPGLGVDDDLALLQLPQRGDGSSAGGGAGKSPTTARLTPPSNTTQIFLSVGDEATARALGESLRGGTFVQRERDSNNVALDAEQAVDQAARGGGGAPLPGEVRQKFESCLETDLSGVRVHTSAESAQAAHAVGARAYATGQDIHFAAGQYDPHSAAGQHLLAHEVAHTVQQSGGVSAGRQHQLEVSTPGDAHEVEADRAADAMVSGLPTVVGNAAGIHRMIARDADKDMADAGAAGGDYGATDSKVQVIMGHTTTADQNEAKAVLGRIDAAEQAVARHPKALIKGDGGLGPMKGILAENVDARFVIEQYLATVSDSGNYQSEFAASYMNTKKDYGEFTGMYAAFEAAGGSLKAGGQSDKMASLSKDPEFLRARGKFEGVRDQLKNDGSKISAGQSAAEGAKEGLMSAIYGARAAAAAAKAKSKQTQLAAVMQSINETVTVIMKVGEIAAMATTGILAMGSGGFDMSKLVESSPEIAPGAAAPGAAPGPSMAPPDPGRFATPPGTASPEDGMGKPNDTRSYGMPSQAVDTAKGLGAQAAGALGGPKEMLTKAVTMLEQANIDKLQGQIDAAQEDGNLNAAAAAAGDMKAKRLAYQTQITTLANNVGNLMDHKSQMDTAVKDMVAAAKKQGAGADLTGAIRLVGSGDKFLSQIDLTISLGDRQQQKGNDARSQRYNINDGPFSSGTAQGPGQLHYWTVANDKVAGDFVATKNKVTLQSSGKDSLQSDAASNSTQFDVGKSLEELKAWKVDVQAKRDKAQGALGVGVSAGHSG